jgi:hypothetical protein
MNVPSIIEVHLHSRYLQEGTRKKPKELSDLIPSPGRVLNPGLHTPKKQECHPDDLPVL